jgi:hypothetical protein
MKKKKQTTTKTVETAVKEIVETPTATKPKSNTNGIGNLNKGFKKKTNKPSIYQLIHNGGKDKKGKTIYPVIYMIKAEDIIYDPEKDINRKIRYIPGEPSVFEDEQKKDAKVKAPITFSSGLLFVDRTNPSLKKYLDLCNLNQSNPDRDKSTRPAFKLLTPEIDAQKKLEKSLLELDAVKVALEMPLDKMIGYAKVLGVNVSKSTDEIRYDMKVLAEKDPKSFIDGMDDPMTELKETLMRACQYNIISIGRSTANWIQGDKTPIITHVPLGVKGIDHMAQYCISKKGESTLDHIKLMLSKFN